MCLLTNQIALLGEKDKSSVSNYQKLSVLVRHELGGRWAVKGEGRCTFMQLHVGVHACVVHCCSGECVQEGITICCCSRIETSQLS